MVYHQCGAGSGCHHKITGIIGTAERKDTIAKDMNGQKIPEAYPDMYPLYWTTSKEGTYQDKPPGFFYM